MLESKNNNNNLTMKSKWYPLIVLSLTQILCVADNSIMSTALSALIVTFKSDVAAIQLANSMYPLISGALALAGGLLGLKIGWKKLLIIGLLFLTAGETVAWLSPDMIVFTWVARVLAGLGASFAVPAAIGLIPANYSGKDLALSFGVLGASIGIAASLGPIGGGWIIDNYGWREAFLALAIIFGLVVLSAFLIEEKTKDRVKFKFDYVGTVLFATGIVIITLALLNLMTWSILITISAFVVGSVILILFVVYESKLEKKQDMVLLPSVFLKSKSARDGLIMTALIFLLSGGLAFSLVTYLQVVKEFNALITGYIFSINALGMIIFSIGTPILVKNVNPRRICQLSIVLASVSMISIAMGINSPTLGVLFYAGVFASGAAAGLLSSQAGVIVTSGIPDKYGAQSGGIQGSTRNIGQAIGIALIGLIMISTLSSSMKTGILKNPVTRNIMTGKMKLTKSVPFIDNEELSSFLDKKTKYTDAEKKSLLTTNTKSQITAIQIGFGSFGIIVLFFIFFTFQIPKSYDQIKN
jgi:MFS family permease